MNRILIIDEDPGICYIMNLFLRSKYDVVACTSVQEGIEAIERKGPDLLIIEAHISQQGASRIIRAAQELTPDLPIALMSVCEDEMQAIEKRLGVKLDCHITKPFENDEVVDTLEGILRRRDKTGNASSVPSSL